MDRRMFAPDEPRHHAAALLVGMLVAFFMAVGAHQYHVPPVGPADHTAELGQARMRAHLGWLAGQARVPGSDAHRFAQQYLLATLSRLGLEPELHHGLAAVRSGGAVARAGFPVNVVARVRGKGEGGAAWLATVPYDSTGQGPRGRDHAPSLAVLLEVAGELAADPPPHDVILLFSDQAVAGGLGVRAFLAGHPWAREVGRVVALDGRGLGSLPVLLAAGRGAAAEVAAYGRVARRPVGQTGLSGLMPAVDDEGGWTAVRETIDAAIRIGVPGAGDGPRGLLDPRSDTVPGRLWAERELVAALLVEEVASRPGEAMTPVFFDLGGRWLAMYRPGWDWWLLALGAVMLAVATVVAIQRGLLSLVEVLQGLLVHLPCLALIPGLMALAWLVMDLLPGPVEGVTHYRASWVLAAQLALAGGGVAAYYRFFFDRLRLAGLAVGALLGWVAVMPVVLVLAPDSAYFGVWSVAAAATGLLFLFVDPGRGIGDLKHAAIAGLFAIPGLLLIVPPLARAYLCHGASAGSQLALGAILLTALLVPHLFMITRPFPALLPTGGAVAAVVLLLLAWLWPLGPNRPLPDSLFYTKDKDAESAWWASLDESADEWTAPWVTPRLPATPWPAFLPADPRPVRRAEASPVERPMALVETLSDRRGPRGRELRIQLTPVPGTWRLSLGAAAGEPVRVLAVDDLFLGVPAALGGGCLELVAPPTGGVTVTLHREPAGPIRLRLIQTTPGWPERLSDVPGPRPAGVVPAADRPTDLTLTGLNLVF